MKYEARVTREGRWWAIEVDAAGGLHTQARHLSEARLMARECVAVTLDVPLSDVEVDITVASRS